MREPQKTELEELNEPLTHFEKDVAFLSEKGLHLPDLSSSSRLDLETFLSLLVETYESLGDEIDISLVNPRNEASDAVKKMTLLGTYDSYFMEDDLTAIYLDYISAASLLLRLQESIQKRLYWSNDLTATIGDLLRRINVSTALHTWSENVDKVRTYSGEGLLKDGANIQQPATRLKMAEMLVSAYEDLIGEIQIDETQKPNDTDDIHAWKANQFFIWTESGNFEPDKTGNWNDGAFMSIDIFNSKIQAGLKIEEEAMAPYGAVIAALATLMREYEGLQQRHIEEKIVLNERPFDWHVDQQETGEYRAVNCMPACVEMAIRYQGLPDVPSAEQLRNEYPSDGLGWHDGIAEKVMRAYGVKFTDTFDVHLQEMLDYLDNGNVLYVMYRELDNVEGHSVIIKGYWRLGGVVHFIVSDPDYHMVGPFGYIEYIKDAQAMLTDMMRHLPRYFIIPGS